VLLRAGQHDLRDSRIQLCRQIIFTF